ncbi:MAG TPA: chemotaxis protein CheW [Gemmatimonadaceae bacterium]|nr:chemotaxis protein CheW [Gemmatimonadaceae bacterium]
MKSEVTKLVTFRLGEDLFAADIFAVERVLRYQTPTAVPDAPPWIEGMIEYQSRVLPVINLRRRFELPPIPPAAETRILVLNSGGEWVGAVVDAVLEVTSVDPAQLSAPPVLFRGLAGEYLKGIVRRADGAGADRLVIVLDADRLLSATDRIALDTSAMRGAPAGAVIDG